MPTPAAPSVRLTLLAALWPVVAGCGLGFGFGEAEAPPQQPANTDAGERPEVPVVPLALATPQDHIVRVVGEQVNCTGTLIDDDLVLTAHHCVVERNTFGDLMERDQPPEALLVELGGDDLPWGEVGVRAVVAPPCGHRAGVGDIAILVLERKLIGIEPMTPQLDQTPETGDVVTPVGFGRCAMSAGAVRRRTRGGGTVEEVRDHSFYLSASICPGDSGGPGLDREGRLIGVVSRSSMDGSESTRGRSEFTRLDAFRSVFATAKAISEGSSAAELPPIEGCPEPARRR